LEHENPDLGRAYFGQTPQRRGVLAGEAILPFSALCPRSRGPLLRPEKPLWQVGFPSELLQTFERCHDLAQQRSAGIQPLLSTMGLHLLSVLLLTARRRPGIARRIDDVVQQAQRLLAHRYHERFTVEQLACELHVSYSSFRQAFKAQTGVSPKQYQLRIRLHKARDFLANTSKSVSGIAEILGFDSAFHLSKQFKDAVGLAPQLWRKTVRASRGLTFGLPPASSASRSDAGWSPELRQASMKH
jgi:AraC-like DNA-binding protein